MRNLKVIGKALMDVYDNMFVLLLLNLIWMLLTALPLSFFISTLQAVGETPTMADGAPVMLFLISLLLVLLSGPPTYALAVLMRRVTEFESISTRDFLRAIRDHYRRAWLVGLISVVGTTLLLINLWFYANLPGWGVALVPLFLMILLLWLIMQLFLFPMAVITEGGPGRVLRNAAIVVFRHPGLSLSTGIVALLIAALSTVLVIPWVIVTMGALTALGTRAVRAAVRRDYGQPDEDPIVDEPLPPIVDEDGRPTLPHYGWRAGRQEAGDEETPRT
jgi:uncharacterized membrane protein YesL